MHALVACDKGEIEDTLGVLSRNFEPHGQLDAPTF
jgi:hypothetical protein